MDQESIKNAIRSGAPSLSESEVAAVARRIREETVDGSPFLTRFVSSASVIGAIVGYVVSTELPDNALIQIVVSILSGALANEAVSAVEGDLKYSATEVKQVGEASTRLYYAVQETLDERQERDRAQRRVIEERALHSLMRNDQMKMFVL